MKKFWEIKNQTPFKRADVFLFIFLITVFLILFFSLLNVNNERLIVIAVDVQNERCFTFDFDKKKYAIDEDFTDSITVEKDNDLYTVVINLNGDENVILINTY